jgi:Tol biopolymer transport system component
MDVASATLEGDLLPVASGVHVHSNINGQAAFSPTAVGSIAYRAATESRAAVWLDRTGRETGVLVPPDTSQLDGLRLSPDGRSVMLRRTVEGNTDVWLADASRGALRRLTFGPAIDSDAVFSPDGARIAYAADPKGTLWDLFERPADGTGAEHLLLAGPENESPVDWSPDGKFILYAVQSRKTGLDLWALPAGGGGKPIVVAQTPFSDAEGRFSPDGRWIAFASNESGRFEIYVQPFPGPGPKAQISVGGGFAAHWSQGGREILYQSSGNQLTAVAVRVTGSRVEADTPRPVLSLAGITDWEVTPDGQRFLVSKAMSAAPPITLVLNWKPPAK